MLRSPLSWTRPSRPRPSSATLSTTSSPAREHDVDGAARRRAGWRWTAPPRAPRAGPAPGRRSTSVRTGPSKRSVGRNFSVPAARSTIRVTSAWMSASRVRGRQREDRPADVLDGGVQVVDGLARAAGVTSARSASRGRALQAEADGEQPLDHQVVQVAADPVAVLEDREPLLVLARPDDLQGQRGLLGEAGRQAGVQGVELRRRARAVHARARAPSTCAPVRSGTTIAGPSARPAETCGDVDGPRVGGEVLDRDRLPGLDDHAGQRLLQRQAASSASVGLGARHRPERPGRPRSRPATIQATSAPATSRARSATICRASAPGSPGRQQAGDLRGGRQPVLAAAPPPRRAGRSRWPRRRRRRARRRSPRPASVKSPPPAFSVR